MANVCERCSTKLPFIKRLTGALRCTNCTAEIKEGEARELDNYRMGLQEAIRAPSRSDETVQRLQAVVARKNDTNIEFHKLELDAFGQALDRILEDDHLTEDEERGMFAVAEVLGVDQEVFESRFGDYVMRLHVARVNDGRLPVMDNPGIMLQKGELAHMSTEAELMKEVVHREYQGGYQGFSFPIVKGVRFHTGSVRGKSVVVGTNLVTADTGVLFVTSKRVIFTGARQTLEAPYSRLVSMNVFQDGIQFHLTGRKSAPLFKMKEGMGSVVAATVNAAQH